MKEIEVYRVHLSNNVEDHWTRCFNVLPINDEIIWALENDRQDACEDVEGDDDADDTTLWYDNLLALFQQRDVIENEVTEEEEEINFAGMVVGLFSIEQLEPVIVVPREEF